MTEDKKPEWFDEEKADNFTSIVRGGVDTGEPELKFEKKGRFQKICLPP
ncbi:hypothetical protein M5V91_00860 [Cytobacillus pseudoceanisediminis]|nr:hypothetical protein [Cytobacillus pseudoceanisediminis]UQX54479.1 hypothetical protein M5V91_00860 [Cytobacillus pseudoceanisediminis]